MATQTRTQTPAKSARSGRVSIVLTDGRIVGLIPTDPRARALRAAADMLLSRPGVPQASAGSADAPLG